MLINGDDDTEDLGFSIGKVLKKAASFTPPALVYKGAKAAAPKVASAAKAVAPYALIGSTAGASLLLSSKVRGALASTAGKVLGAAGGGPAPTVDERPACGFFQRLSKFFGGAPDCQ